MQRTIAFTQDLSSEKILSTLSHAVTDILEMVAHLYVTSSLNQFQSIQLPYTDSAEEAVLDKTDCTATVTSALQRRSIVKLVKTQSSVNLCAKTLYSSQTTSVSPPEHLMKNLSQGVARASYSLKNDGPGTKGNKRPAGQEPCQPGPKPDKEVSHRDESLLQSSQIYRQACGDEADPRPRCEVDPKVKGSTTCNDNNHSQTQCRSLVTRQVYEHVRQKAIETLLQAITLGTGKISNTLGATESEDSYNYRHKKQYLIEQGSMKPPWLEKVPVIRRKSQLPGDCHTLTALELPEALDIICLFQPQTYG
ncbi:hypothetical protein Anapl_07182 [Anas platyrhynchos]|uniref:Uncharacterized protein n=1 Tax=Anas platyrhynchos TaxID=8839 RepID=R0LCU2_ANAPL|nr:hypothetical protein Anapl_07182 [Anas platyrhynchos]